MSIGWLVTAIGRGASFDMLISELSLSLIAGLFVNPFKASQELLNQQEIAVSVNTAMPYWFKRCSFVCPKVGPPGHATCMPVICTVQILVRLQTEGCPNDHQ